MVQKLNNEEFLLRVAAEHERATRLHASLNSAHEAYAVILEELDEFWEEVRKQRANRNLDAMGTELVQIAAMCCRAYYDLGLDAVPLPGEE